ncbi:hypothetical protein C1H46_024823 [Malus baccata]|uniref:Uncharacterized protein n=1 Tax=Malus baccata TaxID=106549 RepID=A0A540LTF9_MALBA|nr:hypothetical protein C1H46_024823 [Malus baccata]
MNKKTMSSERKMTNAEGLHSRHRVLTRRMARELRLKKEEVREDEMEEELNKKDEEEDEKKEKTQEGVEAKEPTVTESPDQNADGVNSAAAEDVPVRPQPPPAVETSPSAEGNTFGGGSAKRKINAAHQDEWQESFK